MTIKTFPTLYARGNNKKVLEWTITVDGDRFWVTSGSQNGKKVTTKPTICTVKNSGRNNQTTAEIQALQEAQAKWDKRIKSKGYWENIADIDKTTFVEPMLAKKLQDRKHKIQLSRNNPWIGQLKFNGMRCIATKNGLFTRTGERYVAVPHIEESLKPYFDKFSDAVIDGELFNMDLREQLNEIAKLLRRTEHITPEHLQKTEQLVKYYTYDGYGGSLGAQTMRYRDRKDALDVWMLNVKYVELVKSHWIYNWADLDKLFEEFIADQHEGVILRDPESPYENKRSNFLLKHKPMLDDEFLILSLEEGQGNWAGCAKMMWIEMANGEKFKASIKGSMEEGREMLCNPEKYVGKKARVFYFGVTGKNVPNYAQFHYHNWVVDDH